jgi:Integrase zinc binding domain
MFRPLEMHKQMLPARFESRESDSITASSSGAAWIPIDAVELQLRLYILAHTGAGGHRGVDSTFTAISAYFFWTTTRTDVSDFVKSCIHCLATIGGSRVPRPLGEVLHADKPNLVLHFNFLYIGKSSSGPIYILVLRDDMSGYVWLWPCEHANAANTVDALTTFFAAFGVSTTWILDQGSHLKNSLVEGLRQTLRWRHQFSLAYTPWSNGTVEVVNMEIMRVFRALLGEFRMQQVDWPDLVKLVQFVLNKSPSPRLNGLAPITSFTGLSSTSPLTSVVEFAEAKQTSMTEIRASQIPCADALIASYDTMNKITFAKAARYCALRRKSHDKLPNLNGPNISVGDFVLVAKISSKSGGKIRAR